MEAMVLSSGKKGRLRSSSWKVKSAKESPRGIFCIEQRSNIYYKLAIFKQFKTIIWYTYVS